MKKLLLILLCLPMIGFRQASSIQWAQCYVGSLWDHVNDIKQTSDGGYIIGGCIASEEPKEN